MSERRKVETMLEAVEQAHSTPPPGFSWPVGEGEMVRRIRTHNWAATPLGPVDTWPQSLKTVAELVLACHFPMIVLWRPELIQIYNDGYRDLMGQKHPAGLGQPTRDCWPEVWHINEPIYARVWGGETLTFADQLYPITRHGYLEQAYFTLCYSPVRDESEEVGGVLVTVFETTRRLRAEAEQQRTVEALRESGEKYRAIFNSINEGFSLLDILFDEHGQAYDVLIRDANPAQDRIDGVRALIGKRVREFLPNIEMKWIERYAQVARSGEPEHFQDWSEATQRWYEVNASRVGGPGSSLVAIVYNDITERKRAEEALRQSLAEKEELLKEVHHRVKNNLQVITSLLNLQAAQVEDKRVLALFEETRNRVQSIAAIHELIYRSASFSAIELNAYARQLAPDLVRIYGVGNRIRVEVRGEGVSLELHRAVPFGLLLNELVSNVCKHAFPGGVEGNLTITIAEEDGHIVLQVADTGVGLPEGFDVRRAPSLGLQLVYNLTRQLKGTIELYSGRGTTVQVRLPKQLGPDQGEGSA